MRYGADTGLTVKEVMTRAMDYFGPKGPCGLAVTEEGLYRTVFAGGGGYVIASAHRAPSGSHIELEVWEFDAEARTFITKLPSTGGWRRRLLGR